MYSDGAPHVDPAVFDLGVPILGICYGLQVCSVHSLHPKRACQFFFVRPSLSLNKEIAWNLKGKVAKCDHREYGFAQVKISKLGDENSTVDALFQGLGDEMQVPTLLS